MSLERDAIYTVQEVAEILRVDRHRVNGWLNSGWLKSFKAAADARQRLIPGSAVWDMINRHMNGEYPG